MTAPRYVEGLGEVEVASVGNTSHSTQIRVVSKIQGNRPCAVSFAVLLDEDLRPRLQRVADSASDGPGDLATCARLAEEFLHENLSARYFLMLGRIEMDLDDLLRERELAGRGGRPHSSLVPRIEQLERARASLTKWAGKPTEAPFPERFGPSVQAPFGFTLQPLEDPVQALKPGSVTSFANDAVLSAVTTLAVASHGDGRNVVGFSFRNDLTGSGRMALYDGLTRTDSRFTPWVHSAGTLPRLIEEGALTDRDLAIVETTVPVVSQAQSFLRRLEALGANPTVIVIEPSSVHVGKASDLLVAFERKPTLVFFLDEVERRLAEASDLTLGDYISIVDIVAGRCGLDIDEAFEAFRRERGDAYSIHPVERSGPGF